MRKRIFIVDSARYDLPFSAFGKYSFDYREFMENPRAHKLVVLTGGEDVTPSLYGHPEHKRCGWTNPQRDAVEMQIVFTAMRNRIPVVGICRGAQLLNVLAGGWLVQDCDNHTVWHDITTSDDKTFSVSSTHHQLMIPPKEGELLAWASEKRSTYYHGGPFGRKVPKGHIDREADCIFFPRRKWLAMQYHPEYMHTDSDGFKYAIDLIQNKLGLRMLTEKNRDHFVSLPKIPITEESEEAWWKEYEALETEEDKKKFGQKENLERFVLNRARLYQSRLFPRRDAIRNAKSDMLEYAASMVKAEQQEEEVQTPEQAAGVSE